MKWLTDDEIAAVVRERRVAAAFEIQNAQQASELLDVITHGIATREPHRWPQWLDDWMTRIETLAGRDPVPLPRTRGQ